MFETSLLQCFFEEGRSAVGPSTGNMLHMIGWYFIFKVKKYSNDAYWPHHCNAAFVYFNVNIDYAEDWFQKKEHVTNMEPTFFSYTEFIFALKTLNSIHEVSTSDSFLTWLSVQWCSGQHTLRYE